MESKINERTWSGHLVSWIKEAVVAGTTIFQDATNDQGVKMESKVTKFPDILLFTDKVSGTVFNGWELKFPDTAVDDFKMLENALEKAKTLRSNSFVTWNGSEAVIWKIPAGDYSSVQNLQRLKHYPKAAGINRRNDLEDWASYQKYEPVLKERLLDILADLKNLLESGEIKEALSISETFIEAIKQASDIIIPQFRDEIKRLKGGDKSFRDQYNRWTVYERSTLDILGSSSRKGVMLDEEGVLAKFTFYNLIGKILFYSTLAANLPSNLRAFDFSSSKDLKTELEKYFEAAKAIDYQAVFQPYFTDIVSFSPRVEKTIFDLLAIFEGFDFRQLPTEVIGTILENLVPNDEKQKFGQYFTPQRLANFVAFSAIKTTSDMVFDPTSGTGTFLNSAYGILRYLGNENHGVLLSQIWGNDISHFPAILSVINLYKQNPKEVDNFPRVIRDDFFNLNVGKEIDFPDSKDFTQKEGLSIPLFDSIVSNFPFVQQEDIPDNEFKLFRQNFEKQQRSARNEKAFTLNERADYFTYCIYHAYSFLKEGGTLSSITSNAWLGKEYGAQFKRFLLDNFTIKYIIKTEAEHWFKTSKVITIIRVC
jgi:type I restriction-modification system DNA methylase subunit